MDLSEQLKRIESLMFVLKEDVTTSLDTFLDPKLCKFYKSIYDGTNSINLENGAGDLQDFLIFVGHKINKTWKFDNPTAKALGTWVWGAKAGYDTPEEIFDKMVSLGYDLGKKTSTPYGPKMAFQVAKMVKNLCGEVIKRCPQKFDKTKPKSFYNPSTNSNAKELKQRCETFLNSNFDKLKNNYLKWINNPKTIQKLSKQPSGSLKIPLLRNSISSFDKSKIKCLGPYEQVDFYNDTSLNAQANNVKVEMNYYSDAVLNGDQEEFYSTMVHEFSHYLEKNVNGINLNKEWVKVLPKTIDTNLYHALKADVGGGGSPFSSYKNIFYNHDVSFSDIPKDSLTELKNLGLGIYIFYWMERWNSLSVDDRLYACAQTEKESNLRSIRNLFGKGNLAYELTMNDFKKMFSFDVKNDNISWTLDCYAGSGFSPKPSVFLKQYNNLAINIKDDPTKDGSSMTDSPTKSPEA